jgi:hypothetical protein
MRHWLLSALAVAAIGGAACVCDCSPTGRAEAATFHVDFERGRDEADGLTSASAWKHAPGDPEAEGGPARTTLRPGDVVSFAPHVRYRGAIIVTASGTADAPITFAGEDENASAIIDGSDIPQAVRPCRNADDCAGLPAWASLVRITSATPLTYDSALFADRGLMRPAQSPDPKDGFYRDEIHDMNEVDGLAMADGRVGLPHAVALGMAAGGGRLALWVKPNLVVAVPILRMEGDVARFDPTGLHFYADARNPERAAALDNVSLINEPGEYAILPDGRTVIATLPTQAASVSLASGRGGFTLTGGASHLVFKNLGFENMSDNGQPTGGIAIFADKGAGAADVTIAHNRFHNFSMAKGQGPIILHDLTNLKIVGNQIDTVSLGSGMRVAGTHILIEGNTIHRLGRTGIMLMNTEDALVQRNVVSDALGVHGNGLSAYLKNHNVRFIANTVTDAKQPATYEGAGPNGIQPNDILFANNLLVATPDALGSLISWGWTTGVTIRNNVILGGRTGLRLSTTDTDVTIADNVGSGLTVVGKPGKGGWQTVGNKWLMLNPQSAKGADDAGAPLFNGKVLAEFCTIVMHNTVPLAPGAVASRAIGASITCP